MITRFGKRYLATYLAGINQFPAKDIAIGIDSTSVNGNGNDTRLGFEFYRLPVELGSIDISQTGTQGGQPVYSYVVVYKATIPQDIAGVVKELGLYPAKRTSINIFSDKLLSDFENNLIWYDSNGLNPPLETNPSARIGLTLSQFSASQNASKEYKLDIPNLNISGYSVNDTIALAYNQIDTNLSSIKIKFYSSDSNYYYITLDQSNFTAIGEKISSIGLANLIASGNPDNTAITKIGVEVTAKNTGATTVYLDCLRINDEDTFDPSYGLIARSVLSTPLVKPAGRPVDIEYRLELNF